MKKWSDIKTSFWSMLILQNATIGLNAAANVEVIEAIPLMATKHCLQKDRLYWFI